MRALWASVLCALTSVACSNDNTLSGSAGDYAQLNFDAVAITAASGALIIAYTRNDGSVINRIGIDTSDPDIVAGKTLDGNAFLQDVTFSRAMSDPNDVWPKALNGQLKFSSYATEAGGDVAGSFSVIFGSGGLFPNSGYELLGNFSGKATASP